MQISRPVWCDQFVSYWNLWHNGHPPNSRESRIANKEMRISLAKRFQVFVRKLGQRTSFPKMQEWDSLTCYKFPVSAVTFTENENPSKANRCRIQNNTDLIEKCHKVNLKKATVSFIFLLFLDLELTVRAWFICQAVSWVENSFGQIILQKSGFGKLGLSDLGSLEDPPMVELFCFLETTSSCWNESQTFQNKVIGNWSVVINPPLNMLVWYTAWEYWNLSWISPVIDQRINYLHQVIQAVTFLYPNVGGHI